MFWAHKSLSSYNADCTLCTNLDKSGANHKSRIVYTQVIRIWFDSWFAIRQFATTSSFCTNHQRTWTWFALICLWCVYLYALFVHFGGFLVYSGSFSSQLINYQLIGLWLFVMVVMGSIDTAGPVIDKYRYFPFIFWSDVQILWLGSIGKCYHFFKKICRFLQENFTFFAGKYMIFLLKVGRFSCKNCKIIFP